MKPLLFFSSLLLLLPGCQQSPKTLTDIDGNEYKVIEHEGQLWMAENLRTSHDSNGNEIEVYFPNNDPSNEEEYGLLYDYATACQVCPEGWKLPNNEDWERLLNLEDLEAAVAFKASLLWTEPGNTNSSGFSAKPTGYANTDHPNHFGERTDFWSATKSDEFSWTYIFEKGKTSIRKAEQHRAYAYAVRCVRDWN